MTEPVNPFAVPHHRQGAVLPLCPYRWPEHDDLYVDVCGSAAAFEQALGEFDDFGHLVEGGYVLVSGESGCGKSAMVNRLADRVRAGLGGLGLRTGVVDLTAVLEDQEESIDQRMELVCGLLPGELRAAGLLRQGAEALWTQNPNPRLVFPQLSTALEPGTAVVVLLPTPGDLILEVVRYARTLSSARVVFVTESAMLGDRLLEIEERLEGFRPAVVVQMRTLTEADVARYVADRLGRHAPGSCPGITPGGLAALRSMCPSIKTLQKVAHGTYRMVGSATADLGPEDFHRFRARQLARRGRQA
ncbi:hypothetical protein [Actinokineospora bangkokensis]|uniref:AAA+ ATPase domain-containing protein n=1 Tax=Actinokineospora bangkokensis TaxID=1193682 RepID=A0A1Q9LPA3_9PSEU|nr:hypothetical protein [Actinokineospora bangkokensis]OLR93823.1 hypothetical protein BJP25_16485 [Actinokineospora bangkokensis]